MIFWLAGLFFIQGRNDFVAAVAKDSSVSLASFREKLTAFIKQPRFSAAAWGVQIVSLETGQTLFEQNASKLLKPASNAKLFTAALALDRLGPDFRITTSLYAKARPDAAGVLTSDLIVYGRGDPSFAARFNNGDYEKSLEPFLNAVAAVGIKRIEGDIVGDETYFRGPRFGSGWTWDDLQYYYGAEVSALTLEDNVLDLVFNPGAKPGNLCEFTVKPETKFMTFVNRAATVAGEKKSLIELYRPVGENRVFIKGQIPIGGKSVIDSVAVHDPALFFVAQLRQALSSRGIPVTGKLRTISWTDPESERINPGKLVELASYQGQPLREILTKTLKASQNLYAQLLLLQVGAAYELKELQADKTRPPTAPTNRLPTEVSGAIDSPLAQTSEDVGLAELKKFTKEMGIRDSEILLDDGSGLSRGALVTPAAIVGLLKFMKHHRHADVFSGALPIAGVDGSLRNRMKGTLAAGNIRAKTGHFSLVDTLSGYATSARGEPLVFSIMLNNYSNASHSGREEVDHLAVMLAEFSGTTRK